MSNTLIKKDNWLFFILLVVVAFIYNYHEILTFRPYSVHQWRQTDCASFVLNYYQEGLKFFTPAVHFQGMHLGRGVSEFPGLYYFNALVWKIFGPYEVITRLINIAIVFTGLVYLFKSIKLLLKNSLWAISLSLLAFTSPVFVFYTNSFMANSVALGLVYIGWFHFIKYYKTSTWKYLNFSMLFFMLAALLRSTFLIGFAVVYLLFFLEWITKLKLKINGSKIFPSLTKTLISLGFPIVSIASWYAFAVNYNKVNDNSYFLTKLRPFWNADNKKAIFTELLDHKFGQLMLMPSLMIALILFLILTVVLFKQSRVWWITLLTTFFLTITYLLLWFQNLDAHDYYLVEAVLFLTVTFTSFAFYLKNKFLDIFQAKWTYYAVGIFVSINIYYCAAHNRLKYSSSDKLAATSVFISKELKGRWDYHHWKYNENLKSCETITPYLRSLGIKRTDLVISTPDDSPNTTLYLMDQKGFSDLYFYNYKTQEKIEHFLKKGARYLILHDKESIEKDYLNALEKYQIGQYKKSYVYDLNEYFK